MKKIIISYLIILNLVIISQVNQEWIIRYNVDMNEFQKMDMALDNQHNLYLTGIHTDVNNLNIITIKYNSLAMLQWYKIFDGPDNNSDAGKFILTDNNGNIYVIGESYNNSYNYDIIILKYNAIGELLWVKYYSDPAYWVDDRVESVIFNHNGNLLIAGRSATTGNHPRKYKTVTLKYSPDGTLLWSKLFSNGINSDSKAYDIAVDNSNNVYFAGTNTISGTTNYNILTIKYDPSGIENWVRIYDTGKEARCIKTDNEGNIVVAGWTDSPADYLTLKYSTSGNFIWSKIYDSPEHAEEYPQSMAIDNNANIIISGFCYTNGKDFITVKYNSNGIFQWANKYTSSLTNGSEVPYDMACDESGDIYLAGETQNIQLNYDFITLKYLSNGTQAWTKFYDGPASGIDKSYKILLDNFKNVYVSGISTGNGTGIDLCAIKYSQTIGINPISSDIPGKFDLSQNFPNPFNPTTYIKFDISKSSNVKLTIYDALGCKVETLVNEELKAGTYQVDWSGGNYASGVYFYKLEAGVAFTDIKKMVLIK